MHLLYGLTALTLDKNPLQTLWGLCALHTLKTLSLQNCNLTSPSVLDPLASLQGLAELRLEGNALPPEAVAALQLKLPNCSISA